MKRLVQIGILATAASLALPAAAGAAVYIGRGQVVQDVKVVGDDVRVDGAVLGRVIVVDGHVTVGTGGVVRDITVLGGKIRTEPGARIRGDVFELGGSWPQPDGWPLLLGVGLFLAFRVLVAWLIVSAAGLVARRPLVSALSQTIRERPLRTLMVGVLAGFGLSAASLVLALTLVGLAVAAAIWGGLLAASVAGVALMLERVEDGQDRRAARLALVALTVPVLGDGLAALAGIVGLGALLRHASVVRPRTAEARALPMR